MMTTCVRCGSPREDTGRLQRGPGIHPVDGYTTPAAIAGRGMCQCTPITRMFIKIAYSVGKVQQISKAPARPPARTAFPLCLGLPPTGAMAPGVRYLHIRVKGHKKGRKA
jgi:hypothetical protein